MPQQEATSVQRESARVVRGSAACMAAHGFHLALRFLITPFVLAAIGLEAYGFWALLFAMLGLLGIHRMGIMGSVVAYVARYHAAGEDDRLVRTVRTGASLALLFAVAMMALLFLAGPTFIRWSGTSGALAEAALHTLWIAAGATLMAMVLGGYQGTLEALQEHPRVRLVDAMASIGEAVLTVILLASGQGLVGIAIAYALRLIVPIPVFARMARRKLPGLHALPGRIDRVEAGHLLRFGGAIQLLGILHLAIAAVDRGVLAHVVSLAAAGAYEIARKLITFAGALPVQGLAPVAPAAARLHVLGEDATPVRELLLGATRIVCLLAAVPIAYFVVFGDRFLVAWVGPERAEIATVLRWLCAGAYVHLATGPITAVLRGLARPRLEVGYAVVWLVASVLLLPLAARSHGLDGVAVAATAAQTLACSVLVLTALPALGVARRTWMGHVAAPIAIAMVGALLTDRVIDAFVPTASQTRIPVLLLAGVLVGVWTLVCAYRLTLDAGERAACRARLLSLRRRTRPSEVRA